MKKEKLKIIYQDKHLIVLDKPANLLTIATANEKINTLYHKLLVYERQKNKNNKIFIVHRLDKDTSGLIMFAKSEKVKNILQDNWDNLIIKRAYVALVEGNVLKEKDTITSWLSESKTLHTYVSFKAGEGKEAITKYEKIKNNKQYSLLNIEILTGRKHQIRVQMESIKHPIVGDKDYGARSNPIRRVCLHANRIDFIHPITNLKLSLESKTPAIFEKLCE